MSRPGITYQQVVNATNQLIAQGIHPTIEAVRKITGTGSHGTLAAHLRRWKEIHNENSDSLDTHTVPEELQNSMQAVWERVLAQANEQVASIEANYSKTFAELEAELQKYKNNNKRWQALYQHWMTEKKQLACDNESLKQQLNELQEQRIKLLAQQNHHQQQLAEKDIRIIDLWQLHTQNQNNLEQYQKTVQEQMRREQRQYQLQQQYLEQDIKTLQKNVLVLDEDKIALQLQLNKKNEDYTSLQQTNNQLSEKLSNLHNAQSYLQTKLDETLEAKNYQEKVTENLREQLNEQHHLFIKLQNEYAMLIEKNLRTQSNISELKQQNKRLNSETKLLMEQKSQLEGKLDQLSLLLKHIPEFTSTDPN